MSLDGGGGGGLFSAIPAADEDAGCCSAAACGDARFKASLICAAVRDLLSRNRRFASNGAPRTFSCCRNLTARETMSSVVVEVEAVEAEASTVSSYPLLARTSPVSEPL